ncbi:MAG: hypothetical protein CML07_04385 [Psychrobacter sp.]|nr:hypothetical protein [Psychrobacter sp.]
MKEKVGQADFEVAHLTELVEEKTDQVKHLREQLTRRDDTIESLTREIDHLTQLLAVQTKTNASLTDRLQVIDDWRRAALVVAFLGTGPVIQDGFACRFLSSRSAALRYALSRKT